MGTIVIMAALFARGDNGMGLIIGIVACVLMAALGLNKPGRGHR